MVGFPELVYSSPTNGQTDVQLGTPIIIDWSSDIDTSQLTDPSILAQKIVLLNEQTNAIIPLSFTSYTSRTRRAILQPTTGLDGVSKYRLIIRAGFKDSLGRKTQQDYTVAFTTLSAGFTSVSLIIPPDGSTLTTAPYSFTWSATTITGTGLTGVGYNVDFFENGSSVGSFTTTDNSLLLTTGGYEGVLGTLSGRTLSWSVTTRTCIGVTGTPIYSGPSTKSSIHFSAPIIAADPSSAKSYDYNGYTVPAPLFVQSMYPDSGATMLNSVPSITIICSQPVASGSIASYIKITRKDQLPRNDIPTSYSEFTVSGDFSVLGRVITFTPSEALFPSSRYYIRVLPGLTALNGEILTEAFESQFSSSYSPYYVDIRAIKAKLRSASVDMPDDLINYYIFLKSLDANALYQAWLLQLPNTATYGDALPESFVRKNTNVRGYAVLRWVQAAVLYEIYASILVDELRNIGRKRALGDYEESLSASFIEGVKAAKAHEFSEMEYWHSILTPSGPMGGGISLASRMSNSAVEFGYHYDLSLNGSELHRGGEF